MALVKVKALDTFSHGRLSTKRGDLYTMNPVDADELAKAGLVEIVGDAAEDSIDDLVGGKAAPMVSNKMEPKPKNKGEK